MTDELRLEKRLLRKAERLWCTYETVILHQIYKALKELFSARVKSTKSAYFKDNVNECRHDGRALYKLLDGLQGTKRVRILSNSIQPPALPDAFAHAFASKVSRIRANMVTDSSAGNLHLDHGANFLDSYSPDEQLNSFSPLTCEQFVHIINSSPSKSCSLDPIPTRLLKQSFHILVAVVTKIVNLSLQTGLFPSRLKRDVVFSVLKNRILWILTT